MLKRAWTVWCRPEERAAIRARARAAGMPVSHLVLDFAFAKAGSHDGAALTAEEMAELVGGFRVLVAFVRMVKGEAVDAGGSEAGPGDGTAVAENTEKDGRLPAERTRLSVSATEEEWTAIRERARRHGLSVSRYLVGLVLPDGGTPGLHGNPLPALGGVEQRELLEAARHMRSLLSGAEDGGTALSGMREWIAAPRDAGTPVPVGSGHARESCPVPPSGHEPSEPGSTASALHSPGAAGRPERAGSAEAVSPPRTRAAAAGRAVLSAGRRKSAG